MKTPPNHPRFKSHRQELLYRLQCLTEVLENIEAGNFKIHAVREEMYNGRSCLKRFGITPSNPAQP